MAKRKTTQPTIQGDGAKPKHLAGSAQFTSIQASTNRAAIYGTAVDFSVDYTANDRLEMIKRLRYGERNCGLVRQILGDYVTYVCGADGITIQCHSADGDKAAIYEEAFTEAAKQLDLSGRFSWVDLQRLPLRGALRDGDSFGILTTDELGNPKIQLVEGHKVGNPEGVPVPEGMIDGVRFDSVLAALYLIISCSPIRSAGRSLPILCCTSVSRIIHLARGGFPCCNTAGQIFNLRMSC